MGPRSQSPFAAGGEDRFAANLGRQRFQPRSTLCLFSLTNVAASTLTCAFQASAEWRRPEGSTSIYPD
jgi:hypothetical protein